MNGIKSEEHKQVIAPFSEETLSATANGRDAQLKTVIQKILSVFENIERGQDIIIGEHKYGLTRHLEYCEAGCAGWRQDWSYRLKREDGEISIYTFYQHNSPQNYMVTEKLSYNGLINTSDKETINKVKGAFEAYFEGEKELPL